MQIPQLFPTPRSLRDGWLRHAALVCISFLLLSSHAIARPLVNLDYVRKSVVFLFRADAKGHTESPVGTGFVVTVPLKTDPTRGYKLLVTARHIADPAWARCPPEPGTLVLRANKVHYDPAKDQKGTADLPLPPAAWNFSPDDEIDAAAMLLPGNFLPDYDVDGVRLSDFPASSEAQALEIGDDIVSAGLLPAASGKKRNYPVFKFGNISSIPSEPADAPSCGTQTNPDRFFKLWFVAVNLVPGSSGSPLFYAPSIFSKGRAVFVGVQSMSFLGQDIAGMTPAVYLYRIIESMPLPDADLRVGAALAQPPTK